MSLYVLTSALSPVVDLEDAKAFLRVDHDDDDDVITAILSSVDDWLAGPSGWLGRSLGPQDLELRLSCFPSGAIVLPKPPLISIASVKYVDPDGIEQTLSSALYETYVASDGLPRVSVVYGESWPATATRAEAVRATYRAGYADDGMPPMTIIPAGLKQAILLTAASMYEARESGLTINESFAKQLFSPYRVYS